jgi:hypothetical protein
MLNINLLHTYKINYKKIVKLLRNFLVKTWLWQNLNSRNFYKEINIKLEFLDTLTNKNGKQL